MGGKIAKKLRKEVKGAGSAIFDEIRKQINEKPLRTRLIFAWRILRGNW